MFRFTTTAAILAIAVALAAPVLAQQTYTLTDIGPRYEPVGASLNIHINASGQIAGTTQYGGPLSPNDSAFVWTPSSANATTGTLAYLPVPSGTTISYAYGINSSGQIVGSRTYATTTTVKGKTKVSSVMVPVEWQANGKESDLPTGIGTYASAIDDSGEIVGATSLLVRGVIYPLPGVQAKSINKSGQVAGIINANTATGYLWTPSTQNGTSGTYVTFPFFASQVNDLGQAAGAPYPLGYVAGLYSASGGVQYLLPTGTSGGASGINNLTQVVGMTPNGAYLWDSTHGVRYLNDATQFTILNGSGWSLVAAEGINDYGQIVGWGTNPAGVQCTFLLTPQ